MIRLLKKLFIKRDIVVYRNGKSYRFKTFAEALTYMTN